MRCSISLGRLIRFGLLMALAAALQTLVVAAPASARSLAHAHRFISRRHGLTMRAGEFSPGYPSFFVPFAAAPETRQQNAFAHNIWRQNGWYAQQDRQRRSAFEQDYWQRNGSAQYSPLDGMVAQQASAAGVPASLVERVIKRESGGNPLAVSRGNYGLMQIRLGTARAMGYSGTASGLLDPANQHDLCRALSRRRLPCSRRQRKPRRRALCARLLWCGEGARLFALRRALPSPNLLSQCRILSAGRVPDRGTGRWRGGAPRVGTAASPGVTHPSLAAAVAA